MNIPFRFYPRLVLRNPGKKLVTSLDNHFNLEELLNDCFFVEAIFLASPVLYDELIKYTNRKTDQAFDREKLTLSVAKYYLRTTSRSTPFGLFSGCSVVDWGKGNTSIVLKENALERHTRLDMHYLCALAHHLAQLPFIKKRLLYYPCSSFYQKGEEIRYIEGKFKAGKKSYTLSSVAHSAYIDNIFKSATSGITIGALTEILKCEDIEAEEALAFIDELIDAQLLINELEPAVTGDEVLYQIIRTLKRINEPLSGQIQAIIDFLEQIDSKLKLIDVCKSGDVSLYRQITEKIREFNIPFEEAKLFQADVFFNHVEANVDSTIQEQLLEALDVLNKLHVQQENPNLVSFIKQFNERYDDKEVPLLEVLDNESGLGYGDYKQGNVTPLLDGIKIPAAPGGDPSVSWGPKESFLLKEMLKAKENNAYSIALEPESLNGFTNNWDQLAPSVYIPFRITDNNQVLVETSGGSSAVTLLGRFAHGNKEINRLAEAVIANEDESNPSVIFAEVVHLPESRIGNVLLHPVFRQYEIPFLSRSAVTNEFQIPLQDILVSVKNNTILLRSIKLGKQIIPRLSTAHNYAHKSLPVYHFLGDLQMHKKQNGIFFTWGIFEFQSTFLPRVVYKKIVLKRAQWNITKKDIEEILNAKASDIPERVQAFRKKWNMPALVVLADADNELLINLEDNLMTDIWLGIIKKRPVFILKEFLQGKQNAAVRDGSGNAFANEFVAFLVKDTTSYMSSVKATNSNLLQQAQQANGYFPIGSEWIYYKIYCGVKNADVILVSAILPAVKELLEKKYIQSFFFIRYNDPGFHLRVRFKLSSLEHLNEVMQLLKQKIQIFEDQQYIWKIQLDAYKQEITRYSPNAIAIAEHIFFYDSIAVLNMLARVEGDQREAFRWIWAIKAIDEFLNDFGLAANDKMNLLEQLKESFHKEFNSNKTLRTQIGNKYRDNKKNLEDLMQPKGTYWDGMPVMLSFIREKSIRVRPLIARLKELQDENKLEVPVSSLLSSYIHMLINRVIALNPRQHELVIYDMLYTYYRSAVKRSEQKEKLNLA